jgi:hypothetical protein
MEYKRWRKKVFIRDNYTCQLCSIRNVELHAHHKKPKSTHRHLIFEVSNGITLCGNCHNRYHSRPIKVIEKQYITKRGKKRPPEIQDVAKEIINFFQFNKKCLILTRDVNRFLKAGGYGKGTRKKAIKYLTDVQLVVSLNNNSYLLHLDSWLKLPKSVRYKLLKSSWIPYIKCVLKERFYSTSEEEGSINIEIADAAAKRACKERR